MSEEGNLCDRCKHFSAGSWDSRWHPGESPDCNHPKVYQLMTANMKRGPIRKCKHFEDADKLRYHRAVERAAERAEGLLEALLGRNSLGIQAVTKDQGPDGKAVPRPDPHVCIDGDIYIMPCKIKERGLGRTIECDGWLLTTAYRIPATRWEPEDGGYTEHGESRVLDEVIRDAAKLILEWRYQRFQEDEFAKSNAAEIPDDCAFDYHYDQSK